MFMEIIFASYSLYKFIGVAHKVKDVVKFGADCFIFIKKNASYFAGKDKDYIDLNDSFLIERETFNNSSYLNLDRLN